MENIIELALPYDMRQEDVEIQLIEAAKANPAKFAQLYHCYAMRVYRYLRTRTNSNEDAADLTQQVFLQVFEALPKYHTRGVPFAAWLFRITRHVVVDYHRRTKITQYWDLIPNATPSPREQDPEAIVIQHERLTHLRSLLARLNIQKRELLALRFAAGLSTPEIAQVVGKSHASVKKQITRIMQSLKEQYHYE